MATPLGKTFSTDENIVAQTDVQPLEKTIESFVVEFDQGKFKEFLSSGSTSLKAMWQYRKVSLETYSRISSEISSKVARTIAHNASGATSQEVLKPFRAARAARVNISQETRRASISARDYSNGEDQSCHHSPL